MGLALEMDCKGFPGNGLNRTRIEDALEQHSSCIPNSVPSCPQSVAARGFEPRRLSAQDPKSCVSANFTKRPIVKLIVAVASLPIHWAERA